MPVQTRSGKTTVPVKEVPKWKQFNCRRAMGYLKNSVLSLWDSYLESDCQMRPDQLVGLGEHKYSATDVSWLDELCMKRFWEKVVIYCPLWLAPNTITLIGLIINLSTVMILSYFCFSSTESAPSWAYFQAALGLFLYQTLDAIDGKQARRTNSSSPLGELFDHGCDSMSQVFVMLNVCHAMQLGEVRYMVLICVVIAVVVFYCAHWSTYCTGQLRFAKFDVTEAQMVVISTLLVTAFFGPGIWQISVFGTKLKHIAIFSCLVLTFIQIGKYIKIIFTEGAGKNGATVAGTSVIFPVFPLLFVCIPFCMIYSKSPSKIYDQNITLFSLCLGAVAAKATNRLVIAHMSRSALELWDSIYLGPLVMILNQYYDFYFDEYRLLVLMTIYAYANLLLFCWKICEQFCWYLNIRVFHVSAPNTNNGAANNNASDDDNEPLIMFEGIKEV